MSKLSAQLNSPDMHVIRSCYIFKVIWQSERLLLTLSNATDFAYVNENVTKALAKYTGGDSIELEAFARVRTIDDAIRTASRASNNHTVVNINVYGPAQQYHQIGSILSNRRIYLQRPDWFRPATNYANPHVLDIPGRGHDNISYVEPQDILTSEHDEFQTALSEVYLSLSRDKDLKRLEGDNRLRTTLLPHQEQALDFMTQRESGPIPEAFKLWKPITDDPTSYRHIITGMKLKTRGLAPPETGGGILADEMGMGKTYSILALIMRTTEDSEKWSQDTDTYASLEIPAHKRLCKATLIVVPTPPLLDTWKLEMQQRLKVKLKVLTHHGPNRSRGLASIIDSDVVLTTYQTLVADHDNHSAPLNQFAWFRIVLDEAHFIRRQSTLLHKRVVELDAKNRWCLTGTPIQNHLDDIGALFAFIRSEPFDRMGMFRKYLSAPFTEGESKRAEVRKHLAALIDSVCVRRTKEILNLKEHKEYTRYIELSNSELVQYKQTTQEMDEAIRDLEGKMGYENHFGVFQANLQLRLLCNHGTFQKREHWKRTHGWLERQSLIEDPPVEFPQPVTQTKIALCSLCERSMRLQHQDGTAQYHDENCKHAICSECLGDREGCCPVCGVDTQPVRVGKIVEDGTTAQSEYFNKEGQSSKMDALIEDLCVDLPNNKRYSQSVLISTHLEAKILQHRFLILDNNSRPH